MKGSELLDWATLRLRESGSLSPRLEAELLLGGAAGWGRAEVLGHPEREVSETAESAFRELIERRVAAEPMAYLLGEREFYGRVFKADRRALIPRPETELLVEIGMEGVKRWRELGVKPRVVDVGTGSGAIAVSLAAETGALVIATDISLDALELAQENAYQHSARLEPVATDLLSGLRGPLHVVLANLPYVPRDRVLPPDVGRYVPAVALFGGIRGTELIERLLREARDVLAPGGELAVELDEEAQAAPIAALARELYAQAEVRIRQDAGGYDRVVQITLPPPL